MAKPRASNTVGKKKGVQVPGTSPQSRPEEQFRRGPTTYMVPIKLIDGADYNDPQRSDKDGKDIKRLYRSFIRIGQKAPIQVSWNGDRVKIIEGHRSVCRRDYG